MRTKKYFFKYEKNSFSEKYELNKRSIFLISIFLIFLVIILIPTTTRAQTCSTQGSTQLVFGQYDPIAENPLDISTTIEFNCPPAFRGRVIIATIRFLGFSNGATQNITNTLGPSRLAVSFFSDPLRRQPIDGNTIIPIVDIDSQNRTFRITVYGRIEAKQKNVDVGNYFGTLTILLTY